MRVGAGPGLVVARPDDPLPRGRGGGPGRDAGVELVEVADPQVDLGEREPEADHVVVRVVEPGDERRALEVDDVAPAWCPRPAPPASSPTPVIRPPATATAAARGRAGSIVRTPALTSSRSGACGMAQDHRAREPLAGDISLTGYITDSGMFLGYGDGDDPAGDRGAAAAGDPRPAARAASCRSASSWSAGDEPAAGVQAPAGAEGRRASSRSAATRSAACTGSARSRWPRSTRGSLPTARCGQPASTGSNSTWKAGGTDDRHTAVPTLDTAASARPCGLSGTCPTRRRSSGGRSPTASSSRSGSRAT